MKSKLSLLLLAIFSASPPAAAESLPLNAANPKLEQVGELTFLGAVTIPAGPHKITGLSGLWVADDNRQLIALADDGRIFEGQLSWEQGRLSAVSFTRPSSLKNTDGSRKFRRRPDTEALSRAPDGSWLVSFERDHRIWRYENLKATPTPLPALPPAALTLPRNEGLEAMAALPNGGILALAEAGQGEDAHQGWQLDEKGRWQPIVYPGGPGFAPTDLVALSNTDFLVLERRVNLLPPGFQTRLVWWQPTQTAELAWLQYPWLTENFEGLAVTRVGDKARIYLISDDNGLSGFQRTILAVFEISLSKVTKR